MHHRPVITLTTDFGHEDPFVGVMKGVITGINSDANIIDITHGIRPYNIKEAAYVIGMNYRYFPEGSIHVVVVDPGVGSARRPIILYSDNHYFIGPDNGVFSYIYSRNPDLMTVVHITADHYFLSKESPTFQARDVFAPVSAWLSKKGQMTGFGDFIYDFMRLPLPTPEFLKGGILKGEVIHIDRFGNAITNISGSDLDSISGGAKKVFRIAFRGEAVSFINHYAQGQGRGLCALMNSAGLIELFVSQGDASSQFNISEGDSVSIILKG